METYKIVVYKSIAASAPPQSAGEPTTLENAIVAANVYLRAMSVLKSEIVRVVNCQNEMEFCRFMKTANQQIVLLACNTTR